MELQSGRLKVNCFFSFPLLVFTMYVPGVGVFDRPVPPKVVHLNIIFSPRDGTLTK